MSSNKTTIKTVRVSNETADFLKGKDCRLLLESTCEQIKDGKISFDEKGVYTSDNPFNVSGDVMAALKDILVMVKLSVGEDNMVNFVHDFHDRLESGELTITNGKLKLGYHEVFEVLDTSEVKKALHSVWIACDDRGRTYKEGLNCVFIKGAEKAVEDIYGDKR